jgi:DNA-binding NtrC family response regulator
MPSAILILDDEPAQAEDLRRFLCDDYDCLVAHDGARAIAAAQSREIVAALVDLDLGAGISGFDVIRRLREIDPRTAIVIVTGDDTDASLQRARDLDVQDYIHKSVGAQELRRALRRSLILRRVTERVRRLEEAQSGDASALVAVSPAMQRVVAEIERAARHRAPVLITGPVGAGKMLVARAIHERSRPGRPFERVHCATLDTGDLADSQLFGYEPGAHSTAKGRFIGAFERAEEGTLLLDDIDYLPMRVQAKVLQPLEERVIRRLPGSVEVAVQCRVLATTNKDLDALIAAGRFQPDLLSRLRGAQVIRVPGIEERREDLPGLAESFALLAACEMGRRAPRVAGDFLDALRSRRWTDVRQLLNAIRYAVGVSESEVLEAGALPGMVDGPAGAAGESAMSSAGDTTGGVLEGTLDAILEHARVAAVEQAMAATGGDKKAAAARLDITVQWLNAILRGREA